MDDRLMPLVLLVATIQLAGCAATDAVVPTEGGTLAAAPSLAAGASPVIVRELALGEAGGSGVTGTVTLTRSSQGVWGDLEVDGLTPGHAYSIWWAIFDNPQGCDGPCEAFDLRNIRQAQGSLVNGGGFVGSGSTTYHETHLLRHDVEGKSVEAGDASGIDNTYGAEVHVVVRSHGPAESDPANLAVQTSTFGIFCNLPGCANVAASMFAAPGVPGSAE